jgi:hypothetical protein
LNFEHLLIVRTAQVGESTSDQQADVAELLQTLRNGLRLLAIRPQALGQDLDGFELHPVDATGLYFQRVITRGSFVMEDSVQIASDGLSFTQSIMNPDGMRGSHKQLAVEQPRPGLVTLRARYQSNPQSDQGALNANEIHAIESAYVAADQDFLMQLSKLHSSDMLDALVQVHLPPFVRH